MITIDAIVGNAFSQQSLKKLYDEMLSKSQAESIRISRMESFRIRMRKTSTKGTDVVLTLPTGSRLRHGDVLLLNQDKMIIVELEPENVIVVEVREGLDYDELLHVFTRVGHAIGNLHRPLKLTGRRIIFPLQADSEIELFRRMLAPFGKALEIGTASMIFEPDEGMDVNEH